MRILSGLLIILGALLLAAGIYIYQPPRPYLDLHRAGSPLIDVPVTGQAMQQAHKVRIPDDPMWKTLERELGQPQFFIGGVAFYNHSNHVLCAKTIGLTVTVSSDGHPIPLQSGDIPYAYNSSNCAEAGFDFSARNGECVEIEISTRSDEPTMFDVKVVPVWPTSIKDAYIGAELEPLFRRLFWTLTTTGAVLLAAGITIILMRRKRAERSIAP